MRAEENIMTSETFKEKVHTMRPMLVEVAKEILGNQTEAEDVAQEALLRLWQLRDEPIRDMENLARVVVQHLSVDTLRRRHKTVSIHEYDFADVSPPEGLNDEEERMMVHIAQLPMMQQTILRLRHVEEMEIDKIATMIGMTEVAVRQTLSRARRKIFAQFTKKGLKR